MQISEFKDSLKQSVSHEWIDKMNVLEKENAELQEVKRNFEAIKSDYEKKKRECEWEKEKVVKNAEYEARRARLRDLMKDVQKMFWDVSYTYKLVLNVINVMRIDRFHIKHLLAEMLLRIVNVQNVFRLLNQECRCYMKLH